MKKLLGEQDFKKESFVEDATASFMLTRAKSQLKIKN
jgi:hypothetical protein